MKLCRFELESSPGQIRSGVFHDGKVYETDGSNAIGIHELSAVRFAPPIGQPPSIRIFEDGFDQFGQSMLSFRYLNPTTLLSPGAEVEMSPDATGLELGIHIGIAIGDTGKQIEVSEAEGFVLGYMVVVSLNDQTLIERDKEGGFTGASGYDAGLVMGPFLTTSEELTEHRASSDPTDFKWSVELQINGESIWIGEHHIGLTFSEMVSYASRSAAVVPGDVIALPAVRIPALTESTLGRSLLPSDKVLVRVAGLGALTATII